MHPDDGIILFDGTCAFCEGVVTFVATRDPHKYFRFGASQNPSGLAVLGRYGFTQSARSIVLIEDGQIFLRSTASLRIARHLTWPWSLARHLLVIPRPVRDAGYRVVAAIRHRLAGTSNACEIPPPEIRGRMI
jgi:predicted DCC family thiol-disulfide oxidoreductase YuxK